MCYHLSREEPLQTDHRRAAPVRPQESSGNGLGPPGRLAPPALRFLAALFALLLPGALRAGPLLLSPCRLPGGLQARCGQLEVPEDRSDPGGRRLRLRVAVVPSLARSPRPDPLFLLAGGPGAAASAQLPLLVPAAFDRVRKLRDLVLVDQRGTGASNPLECARVPPGAPLAERLSTRGVDAERLAACRRGWQADVRFYTTLDAALDLDAVRAALGAEQVNLWGGSYGSRLALVYLQQYGAHVRSLVLDGVAPPAMRLPLHGAEDAERAMRLLLAACAAEAGCAASFPDLSARWDRLLARLAVPVRATVADPLTGAQVLLDLDRDLLAAALHGALYQPAQAALVPLAIARAESGDFSPIVALGAFWQSASDEAVALGLYYAVVCAEDAPRIELRELEERSRGTFLGAGLLRRIVEACAGWPRAQTPADVGAPIVSGKPALLLSGELDPVTPPSWAALAASTLSRGRLATAPGAGHGVSGLGCSPRLIAEFLERGGAEGLDTSCLARLRRPPFFTTFAGPPP